MATLGAAASGVLKYFGRRGGRAAKDRKPVWASHCGSRACRAADQRRGKDVGAHYPAAIDSAILVTPRLVSFLRPLHFGIATLITPSILVRWSSFFFYAIAVDGGYSKGAVARVKKEN